MKNYVQPGNMVTVTAPAAVSSGEGVVVGSMFGIAATSADSGEPVSLALEGVFDLPKDSIDTFAAGALVSWDAAGKKCEAPGSGRYPIGHATQAAGSGAGTVRVRLSGVPTAAAA